MHGASRQHQYARRFRRAFIYYRHLSRSGVRDFVSCFVTLAGLARRTMLGVPRFKVLVVQVALLGGHLSPSQAVSLLLACLVGWLLALLGVGLGLLGAQQTLSAYGLI